MAYPPLPGPPSRNSGDQSSGLERTATILQQMHSFWSSRRCLFGRSAVFVRDTEGGVWDYGGSLAGCPDPRRAQAMRAESAAGWSGPQSYSCPAAAF
ncbi:hypothetical protein ES703_118691 [subsurface metagenome]